MQAAALADAQRSFELACAEPTWSDVDAAAAGDGAEKKLRRFSMLAYTGGPMRVAAFFRPIVIDLAGLKRGKSTPILKNHDPNQIVGHSDEVEITPTRLSLAGVISAEGAAAQEVIASSRNGFPWQASVGASVDELEVLAEGQTAIVNGQTVRGPVLIARKSTLGEVSFVPRGADPKTSARVAASATRKAIAMKFEQWCAAKHFDVDTLTAEQATSLQALYDADQDGEETPPKGGQRAPKAGQLEAEVTVNVEAAIAELRTSHAEERKRVSAIEKLAAKFKTREMEIEATENGATVKRAVDVIDHAIEAGWSAEKAELQLLRQNRVQAPAIHIASGGAPAPRVIEAAICLQGKLPDVEKRFDEKTLEAAEKAFGGALGLQQVVLESAWEGGYQGRHFVRGPGMRAILEAAFSTLSLPGILSNTANKFLKAGFEGVENAWREIAAVGSVKDFKEVKRYRLAGDMEFEELGKGGKIKHGNLAEDSTTNQARTYAKMYTITREDLINDDLDALSAVPRLLGRGAALKLNKIFWTEFLDNATFFASGNKNYAAGAGTALSISALTQAETLFFDQVDTNGDPLAIAPAILLVPNALYVLSTNIMQSTELRDTTANTKAPTSNPHAGKFRPVRSSYLANASIPGSSALAWYLIANPADLPVIEVVFLDGKEVPVIESADAMFDELGIQMRGYQDAGVKKQEKYAGVKMKGEA